MLKQIKPYLKNLADALRNWSNTSEKINAQDFPNVVQWVYDNGCSDGYTIGYDVGEEDGFNFGYALGGDEGYEAGKQAEYDRFWDAYQENGKRAQYEYAFADWKEEAFKPKYNFILQLGHTGQNMFWRCRVTNIAEVLEKQGIILDTTKCGNMSNFFQNSYTTRIPVLNCTHAQDYSSNGLYYAFYNCQAETIDKLIVTEDLMYIYTFGKCTNLKNIVFEGVIGNNIDFQSSPLSKDSITNIVNHLSETKTGQTLTLKKSAVNDAFSINVDDESTYPEGSEFYTLRHSKDNWTFSYV